MIVTLTFKRKELLYDAENYSFVEGDIMPVDEEHSRHQVFDIGQSGNVDRVTRVLNLRFSECIEMLYPYAKNEVIDIALDNSLSMPEEYTVSLNLPEEFSQTTINLLNELIHEYLVCRVVADWMSITNPSRQETWDSKAEGAKRKIQTSLMSRRKIPLRKMNPF